jgi:hypothetical protein
MKHCKAEELPKL